MHTIIIQSTDLCDKPVYRVYNFGQQDICHAYTMTDDGVVPGSQMITDHKSAYELISWGIDCCGYKPFADTRAVNELEYHEYMCRVELD